MSISLVEDNYHRSNFCWPSYIQSCNPDIEKSNIYSDLKNKLAQLLSAFYSELSLENYN